jgi:spore coat protein U-like protein
MNGFTKWARAELVGALGRAAPVACALLVFFVSAQSACAALACTAANVMLNYGAYDVLAGAALTGAGSFTVSCTKTGRTASGNVTYTAKLTPLSPRELAPPSGTDRLTDEFYVDSGLTQPWGDGTAGTFFFTGTLYVPRRTTRADVPKNFYAEISPGGQDVSAASPGPPPTTYTETLTVSVTCISPALSC